MHITNFAAKFHSLKNYLATDHEHWNGSSWNLAIATATCVDIDISVDYNYRRAIGFAKPSPTAIRQQQQHERAHEEASLRSHPLTRDVIGASRPPLSLTASPLQRRPRPEPIAISRLPPP